MARFCAIRSDVVIARHLAVNFIGSFVADGETDGLFRDFLRLYGSYVQ